MPAPLATAYQDFLAKRRTDRSDMPMCIAMLQNHAKNITCQNVNFVWPGSGSPPFQICVLAKAQTSDRPWTGAPVTSMNCLKPTSPNAMNTSTIHGEATSPTLATISYPYAATTTIIAPDAKTAMTQPRLFG